MQKAASLEQDSGSSDAVANRSGVYSIVVLNAPTCINEIPTAMIARFVATIDSVE